MNLKRFRLESSLANLHEERDTLEDLHKVSGQELTSRQANNRFNRACLPKEKICLSQDFCSRFAMFLEHTGLYRYIYIHLAILCDLFGMIK